MIIRAGISATIALGVLACSSSETESKVPLGQDPEARATEPTILTAKNVGAMEAVVGGTVVRRGSCFVLNYADEPVILWEEGTRLELNDQERGVVIVTPQGLRIGIGDTIKGGGGALPAAQPIQDFARETVPDNCATLSAVQIHSIEKVERVHQDDPAFRRPLPPPPPPSPSSDFLESAKSGGAQTNGGTSTIADVASPREALFVHVLTQLRESERGDRPACLRQTDDALFARLSGQFDGLYRVGDCRWDGGGVVLRANDRSAALVDVRVQCDGKSGCVGEGAVTYGNLGGEGQSYFLEPTPSGWTITRGTTSWMS